MNPTDVTFTLITLPHGEPKNIEPEVLKDLDHKYRAKFTGRTKGKDSPYALPAIGAETFYVRHVFSNTLFGDMSYGNIADFDAAQLMILGAFRVPALMGVQVLHATWTGEWEVRSTVLAKEFA
jgi:streptomycin 6-kinase